MITSTMRRDTASRLVKASPSAVYAAFVASEAVAQWLPPEGAMMESKSSSRASAGGSK